MREAKFPVDELSFDEDGIIYHGSPFSVASRAGQIRVSMAIGFSFNPDIKIVTLEQGNDLDKTNLRLIAEMVRDHGVLCLMEKVGTEGGVGATFVMDNGTLIDNPPNGPQRTDDTQTAMFEV